MPYIVPITAPSVAPPTAPRTTLEFNTEPVRFNLFAFSVALAIPCSILADPFAIPLAARPVIPPGVMSEVNSPPAVIQGCISLRSFSSCFEAPGRKKSDAPNVIPLASP